MLNKLYKILFISLFLATLQSYAAPPPLPPALSNSDSSNEVSYDSDSSIFDKIKNFFGLSSRKTQTPQLQTKQNDQEEFKLASQEPDKNGASEPFIDTGNKSLPTASNETNVNLDSHDNNNVTNTESSKQTDEHEASEPFIDIGNTPLPRAANNDLPDNKTDHGISTNLAAANMRQPITPNVSRPIVTMPPLKPGTPVVPPHPNLIIAEPPKIPPTHIPTPVNSSSNTTEEKSNVTPPVTPVISPPNPNAPQHLVSPPTITIPNNTSSPATTPSQPATPAPTVPPTTPNIPPTTAPVINSPAAPNTAPNNLPTTPIAPIMPAASPTTNSSNEINNQQQTFTANADSSKNQGWDTPLKPVEVIIARQNQGSNNNVNPSTNQTKPQNIDTPKIIVKQQDNIINHNMTELATKFAKNESQMLLLPNDDMVLGKLTEQATLDQMDMYAYIKLFQKKESWIANADRRKSTESLIKFDNDINKKKDIYATLSYCNAVYNSFRAIDRNNLSKLRVLLDVYPILQEKNNKGDTLLTASVYNDNYYLAKYLVIRGIKISTLNSKCQYPLDIALAQGNNNIACMLTKAKGYN